LPKDFSKGSKNSAKSQKSSTGVLEFLKHLTPWI